MPAVHMEAGTGADATRAADTWWPAAWCSSVTVRPWWQLGLTYVRDGHILANMKTNRTPAPLTPLIFSILPAPAMGHKQGDQIMKQAKHASQAPKWRQRYASD